MTQKIKLPVELNIDAAQPGQVIQGLYDKAKKLQDKTDAYSKRKFEEYSQQLGKLMDMDGEVTIQTTINTTQEKGLDGVYKTVYKEVDKLQSKVLQGLDKENKARSGSVTSLKQQLATQKQLLNATAAYVTQVSASGKKFRAINPEIAKIQAKVNQLGKDLNEAFAATGQGGNIVTRISSLGNKMTQLSFQIQAVGQAIQVIQQAASQFVNRAKDIQRVQLAFEALGVSVANQDQILKSSRAIALTYGASIQKIEKAYLRLGPAIMQSGGSLSDTEKVIEAISAKAVTLGLNTEQTGRYIEAFAQVMGKGKLQGEELNQQFAELDGALRGQIASYMESAYGIKDLGKAMQDGEISAQMFKEAFIASAEESRKVVAGSMGEIQKSISTIGEKGGTTIQQVMARINSLITIAMESMGEALAPLGESLLRISAAFAQFFAKIATSMPGIQTMFKELSAVIGVLIEWISNGLMIVIYEIAAAFEFWIQKIQEIAKAILGDNWAEKFSESLKILNTILGIVAYGLIQIFGVILGGAGTIIAAVVAGILRLVETLGWLVNLIPGMKGFTQALAEAGDMRSVIDAQTALDEAITGTTNAFKKEEEEIERLEKELQAMKDSGLVPTTEKQKELNAAIDALNTKKAEAEMKRLEGAYGAAKTKLNEMIEAQRAQLDRDKQLGERKIEVLNKEMEAIKRNADAKVNANKKETEEVVKGVDEQIRQIQRKSEVQKRETEDERNRLNSLRNDYRAYYDGLTSDVEAFYDRKRSEMEASHAAEISNLDAEIAKIKEKYAAELDSVSSGNGPQQQRLQQMKLNELRKEASTAETAIERQRARAEIEKIQNSKRRAQIEKQQAKELKKLEEEKAQKEKEQAEEKKRLDEEEKKRKEEIKAAEMKTMEEIKTALEVLAGIDEQNNRDSKDRITDLKEKKREAKEEEKKFIDDIREKEKKQHEERKKRIDFIKEKLGEQEDKLEDIEAAVDDMGKAERGLEDDIDYITNGALQRQLEKARAIGIQLSENAKKSGGDANAGAQPGGGGNWRGGPVTGGTTYRVNEIGKEGFVGKDGSMFELPGSANSRFTAPIDGEIIPANVWSKLTAQEEPSKTPVGKRVKELQQDAVANKGNILEDFWSKSTPQKEASEEPTNKVSKELLQNTGANEGTISENFWNKSTPQGETSEKPFKKGTEKLWQNTSTNEQAISEKLWSKLTAQEEVSEKPARGRAKELLQNATTNEAVVPENFWNKLTLQKEAFENPFEGRAKELLQNTAAKELVVPENFWSKLALQEETSETPVNKGVEKLKENAADGGDKPFSGFYDDLFSKAFTPAAGSLTVPKSIWDKNDSQGVNSDNSKGNFEANTFPSVDEKDLKITNSFDGNGMETFDDLLELGKRRIDNIRSFSKDNTGSQPSGGSRWRGGPVTSGTTYRVNEIGKEGFVGKDGSMFELPGNANNRFTAPMDGEIIPANVWSEMKAQGKKSKTPKGANVRFGNSSTRTSSVATSNNVVNNVTVQSNNPTKTASTMMVELARIKRSRYS